MTKKIPVTRLEEFGIPDKKSIKIDGRTIRGHNIREAKKRGTPMVVSEKSPVYDMPPQCKDYKHKKWADARVTFTFVDEDVKTPYFPVKFAKVCVECAEIYQYVRLR